MLCFKKNTCSTSVKLPSVKSHAVYFLKKNFICNKNLKYSRDLTFLWVWSLSCHITFFEKNWSKIYSLTMIFGHRITFNIFYQTLAVRQNLHKREYFTLQNVIYLVSDFYDVVTSCIFKKY